MKLDNCLIPDTKINSKRIRDLNIRSEVIKPLKENIEAKFLDISLSIEFLDLNPKAEKTKAKINKWVYFKLKSFCTSKAIINKMKKQPPKWEKSYKSHILQEVNIYNI